MAIPKDLAQLVLERGFNSSHPIWLTAKFEYFESLEGWVFAFTRQFSCALCPLEPLFRGQEADAVIEPYTSQSFASGLNQFKKFLGTSYRICFVAVGQEFSEALQTLRYASLPIGQDPWLKVKNYAPRGNSGKGIRAARNQILKQGAQVDAFDHCDVLTNRKLMGELSQVLCDWRDQKLMMMEGFLLTNGIEIGISGRRLFTLRIKGRLIAYLLATPVRKDRSYYLEDIVYSRQSPKGCSEVLILAAIEDLEKRKIENVSLGVVSVTGATDRKRGYGLRWLETLVSFFYDGTGTYKFRKRFAPDEWRPIFLLTENTVSTSLVSKVFHWPRPLTALILAFKPRPRLTKRAWLRAVSKPVQKNTFTFVWLCALSIPFALLKIFPNRQAAVTERFGFAAREPLYQWVYRSLISDWITIEWSNFLLLILIGLLVLPIIDRKFKKRLIFPLLLIVSLGDDIVSASFFHIPLILSQPDASAALEHSHQIGASLILSFFAGLAVNSTQRSRELLFIVIQLGLLFSALLTNNGLAGVIENLHHLLLFSLGYIFGKLEFERRRLISRGASHGS